MAVHKVMILGTVPAGYTAAISRGCKAAMDVEKYLESFMD